MIRINVNILWSMNYHHIQQQQQQLIRINVNILRRLTYHHLVIHPFESSNRGITYNPPRQRIQSKFTIYQDLFSNSFQVQFREWTLRNSFAGIFEQVNFYITELFFKPLFNLPPLTCIKKLKYSGGCLMWPVWNW